MRLLVLIVVLVFLGGCSNVRMLQHGSDNLVLATKQGGEWCYTRIVGGAADGQVCTKGDFIRYRPNPKVAVGVYPIPNEVLALLETRGGSEANVPQTAFRDIDVLSYSPMDTTSSFTMYTPFAN